MATQFVPYSVMMRQRGYVLDGKKWIPEAVMEMRREREQQRKMMMEFRKMMNSTRGDRELASGMSWGSHAELEQARLDARFVAMTEEQWREHLRTDRSQSVEEIARLRALRQQTPQEETPMPEQAKTPAYWFREYVNFPHLYFSSEAEQKEAIAEVLADWKQGVGRWRAAAMEKSARVVQTWWRSVVPQEQETCRLCNRACVSEYYAICEDCQDQMVFDDQGEDICRRCGWDGADVQDGVCWECEDLQVDEQNPLLQWVRREEDEVDDDEFEPEEAPLCHGCGHRRASRLDDHGYPLCNLCLDEHCPICGSFAHTNCKTQKLHYCREEYCDWTCGVQECGSCIDTCRCRDILE
jgi:hypothetical protein